MSGTVIALTLAWRLPARRETWQQRIQALRARPWAWTDGGLILCAVLLLVGVAMAVGARVGRDNAVALLMVESLLIDVAGLALVSGYLGWRGYTWQAALGLRRSGAGRFLAAGAVAYLALLPLVFFSSAVYQGILSAKGYPPNLQDVALLLSGEHPLWVRLYMLVLAVAVAPLFEETLFRGILLPLLARRLGTGTGVFLTSLLFAAIHLHVPSLVPLFVIATGFSLAYIYTGSLWTPIAMHGLFNGINLGLMLLLRHQGGLS